MIKGIEIIDLGLLLNQEKILVFADFHIGYEEALNKQGILVPRFQFKDVIKRLKEANTAYPEVVKLLLNLSDENSNCIELGCGSGTYAIELLANNRKCIASDFSENTKTRKHENTATL
ncbi:hypothetical protein KJ878_06140 [Patescibacteria group bacterium]|nr:hypothetical protein [Patescibacteria group bacterium]